MTPDFYSFFMKGIKNKILTFLTSDFLKKMIYSKNKYQFLMNYQNMSGNILSHYGITNKLAHFLKGLRSWAII